MIKKLPFFFSILLIIIQPNLVKAQQTKGLEQGRKIKIPYIETDLGYFQGQLKYFFSTTQNKGPLKSDYAQAFGIYGKYESPIKYGFQAAISGYYIFNPGSSDLSKNDSITNQPNRYEIGLFDIENPGYTDPIKKIEECYIRYQKGPLRVTWGQQLIQTPFINLQDGRMRPTAVDALWTKINLDSQQTIEGGWISGISPRSTSRWMSVEESIGIYPSGVSVTGQKAQYKGHINSTGIFVIGLKTNLTKQLKAQFWETYCSNLFHISFLQLDWQSKLHSNWQYYIGLQGSLEKAIGDGINDKGNQAYIQRGESAAIISSRAGIKNKQMDFSVNYTRIFSSGRYLVPREWGRDPFFTFMPRERNEGLADVHAFVLKAQKQFKKQSIQTGLALGYFALPDITQYAFNKYGMASYGQCNADIRYTLPFTRNKLDVSALFIGKINLSNQALPLKNQINKVEMFLVNFVVHYQI